MPVEDIIRRTQEGLQMERDEVTPLPARRPSGLQDIIRSTQARLYEPKENKMLQETEEGSTVMQILDFLSRGQYATVGAVQALRHGEDVSEAIASGLTGEEKGSWIDVMDEIAPGWHPWARVGVGFVGDVVFDPVNLVPMAWFGKVGKLLKLDVAARAIDDMAGVTKAMKKVGKAAGKTGVGEAIGRRFVPGWTLRDIPGAYEKYRDLQLKLNYIRRGVKDEFIERWDIFRQVAKKLGQDPDKAAAELVRLHEAGRASEILPEYKPFYESIAEGLEKLGKEEVEAGILNPKKLKENYFPHIYEKGEVVERGGELVVKKQKGFFTKLKFRHTPFYAKVREFKTIEEAKKVLKEWRTRGVAKDIAPIENWFRGYAIRRFVGESAIAWKQFTEEALEEFGVPLAEVLKKNLGVTAKKWPDKRGFANPFKTPPMKRKMAPALITHDGDIFYDVNKTTHAEVYDKLSKIDPNADIGYGGGWLGHDGFFRLGSQSMDDYEDFAYEVAKKYNDAALMAGNKVDLSLERPLFGDWASSPEYDILTHIPKGMSLVTATTNLRAPAMRGMFLNQLKKEMREGKVGGILEQIQKGEKLTDILEETGESEFSVLAKLFRKTGGRGVIDLTPEQMAAMVKSGMGKQIYMLPTEFAEEIKNTFKVFSTDQDTKGFIGAIDKATHIWKSMATSMRLPFHLRNAYSNTWLMYLAGVDAVDMPKRMLDAMSIQLKKGKIQGFTADELNNLANRYGVRAYGWMGADVPTMLQKELHIIEARGKAARQMGVGDMPWNPLQAVARFGRKAGTYVEDNARLATFIDQMRKLGISKGAKETYNEAVARNIDKIQAAANHTKKYLFDYTELTQFERSVMKRAFPFYTWMRKNIPLQLKSIVTQPHKYARLGDFENAFFPDTAKPPTEKQIMKHHWMAGDDFRRTPWETENGNPVYYKVDLPVEDLNKFWKVKTWLSALTPTATLLATVANVRTWPDVGKLAKPGQKEKAPWWVAYAPTWLHKFAGIEPIRDWRTGKLVLGMDPQWKMALKTSFPFLNDWETAFPQGGELVEGSGEKKYGALSYLTGVKFRPLDKKQALMTQAFKAREAAENIRRAVRKRPSLKTQDVKEILEETLKP